MVYKLYGLTYEEVKIIEPAFTLNEVDYEACEVKEKTTNVRCLLTEQPFLLYIYIINFHDSSNIRMK